MAVYDRILRVLAAFDDEKPDLSLSEIAQAVSLPISTVHRLLARLTDWGALERNPDRRYVVGTRMFGIGARAPRGGTDVDVLAPVLAGLCEKTRQHAMLAIPDRADALIVDRVLAASAAPAPVRGGRLALDSSSTGLIIQAFGVGGADTGDPRRRDVIREVRKTSIAVGRGGASASVGISTPVFDGERLAAVVSVTAPAGTTDIRPLAAAVLGAGRAMTRALESRAARASAA